MKLLQILCKDVQQLTYVEEPSVFVLRTKPLQLKWLENHYNPEDRCDLDHCLGIAGIAVICSDPINRFILLEEPKPLRDLIRAYRFGTLTVEI